MELPFIKPNANECMRSFCNHLLSVFSIRSAKLEKKHQKMSLQDLNFHTEKEFVDIRHSGNPYFCPIRKIIL